MDAWLATAAPPATMPTTSAISIRTSCFPVTVPPVSRPAVSGPRGCRCSATEVPRRFTSRVQAAGRDAALAGRVGASVPAQRPAAAARARRRSGRSPDPSCPLADLGSGSSTNARSRNRGCGTARPGSAMIASPYSIRSRSSVRGAPWNGRSRPRSRSMASRSVEQLTRREVRRPGSRGVQEDRLCAHADRVGVDEGGERMSGMSGRSRSSAKARWVARSPRLLPRAIATGINGVSRRASASDDGAASCGRVRAPAEQVFAPGDGLLEEAELLAHLAEHHAQHAAVPRVADRLDPVRHFSMNAAVARASSSMSLTAKSFAFAPWITGSGTGGRPSRRRAPRSPSAATPGASLRG